MCIVPTYIGVWLGVCDLVGCLWGQDETKTNRLSLKLTFGKLKDQLCQETSPLSDLTFIKEIK